MNKLFAILIICSLSIPVIAIEGTEAEMTPVSSEALTTEDVNELNNQTASEIDSMVEQDSLTSKFKEPVSKKTLIKKFIIAMLCVAGTSAFLYFALSIYNKLRNTLSEPAPMLSEGEKPLDAPVDLTDAVKSFVEKTKWTE